MDLKSGECLWTAVNGGAPEHPPLERDEKCEVVVVGGGITGALVARELTLAGVDCVLLDRRQVGAGSTAASTAILQYELDTPLVELGERIGHPNAARVYRLCLGAIGDYERIAAELGGDCGFARTTSLYLASSQRDADGLEAECEARRAAGIRVELLDRRRIEAERGFSRPAALKSMDAAVVDPLRLTRALVRAAEKRGLRVYGATAVTAWRQEGDRVVVDAGGRQVRARGVVFATGYESAGDPGVASLAKLKSTYAVATSPLRTFAGWEDRCVMWETAKPYFYLRALEDGRAVIGGEDDEFSDPKARDARIGDKARRLTEKLQGLFPGAGAQAEFAWAGTFGESPDGVGYVGARPGMPGALWVIGLGGNGMCFSIIGARVIRDLVLERENPDVSLLGFARNRTGL